MQRRRPPVAAAALVTADGRWAALRSAEGHCAVLDLISLSVVLEIGPVQEWGIALLHVPGAWGVVAPDRQMLCVRDLAAADVLTTLPLPARPEFAAVSRDHGRILAGGIGHDDGWLGLVSIPRQELLWNPTPTEAPSAAALCGQGRNAIAGFPDGTVLGWKTGAEWSLKCHNERVSAIALTGHGHMFVTGSTNGTIKAWDTAHKSAIARYQQYNASVNAVAISDNAQWVVAGFSDGVLALYSRQWQPVTQLQLGAPVSACTIAAGTNLLTVSTADGQLHFFAIES